MSAVTTNPLDTMQSGPDQFQSTVAVPFALIVLVIGYDTLTDVAVIMLITGLGLLGSTISPIATTIASDVRMGHFLGVVSQE